MALLFNKVLAMREAGFLMPSNQVNDISVKDCVINALRVDNGHINVSKDFAGGVAEKPILPSPSNLPIVLTNDNWSLKTEFFATFNGDLEAGPLNFQGNDVDSIMVRRTSSKNYYSEWEDVKLITKQKKLIWGSSDDEEVWEIPETFTFEDKAIESGIWYKYGIQPISEEKRGSLYQGIARAMMYEDIFLVGEGGKQLRIRYNATVSTFKRNIKEMRTETIGSKYPYITRNGNIDYVELPLTGTITHFMDVEQEFAPRSEFFIEDEFMGYAGALDFTGSYRGLYKNYDLTDYTNPILERGFREKVMDFLLDGKPKLLKSPTEGNYIVRLTDVTFTPNQQLGRMIYDFSCNAVEVDKVSLSNLQKYKIQER